MKTKRILSLLLSLIVLFSCITVPTFAEETIPEITVPAEDGAHSEETAPDEETVSEPDFIKIIHNIAEKYAESGVAEDGNMLWLLADMAVYSDLYPDSTNVLTSEQKQACLDKIIADAAAATAPNALAKDIIALRALGYDAKNVYTASLEKIDVAAKLTALVDEEAASVTNIYTLPYVIIALQQGTDYATSEQMAYLIDSAIERKASWQSTTWGSDGATPMLLALAPYYDTNDDVKTAIDETIPLITALQTDTGAIGNAASTGLAIAGFSALGIDAETIVKNEKSLIDGLMTQATEDLTGFNPTYNTFSTEQGFRGLLSWQLLGNNADRRIFDFATYPMNAARATWEAEGCPVVFSVTPDGAAVEIEGATAVSENKFDLPAGTYNYTVSKAGYLTRTESFTVSEEEARNHTEKTVTVALSEPPQGGDVTDEISVKVKVMVHDENACDSSYTYRKHASSYTALANETITLSKGDTVFDALKAALEKNSIAYIEASHGYISSINNLSEFDHGELSGWMFTVNGNHKNTSCRETKLTKNSTVVWFYTDDYTKERGSESYSSGGGSSVSTYTVKFETNGAKKIKNQKVKENKTVTAPEAPLKEGFTFEGWYTDQALTIPYDFTAKVTKSFTLYAKWKENTFGLSGKHADVAYNPVIFPDKTFVDIQNHETKASIEALAQKGIINGMTEAEFSPDNTMTRAEFATIVTRALGLPAKGSAAFSDVAETDWFYGYINTAHSYGIVNGVSETEFHPYGTITKEEAATMLARAACLCGMDTTMDTVAARNTLAEFSDYVTISDWAFSSVAFCYYVNIFDRSDMEVNPKTAVTRAEIAEMLYHLLGKANLL